MEQPRIEIDERLRASLEAAAARQRRLRAWWVLAAVWGGAAGLGFLLYWMERQAGVASPLAPLALACGALVAAFILTTRKAATPTDWRRLALEIEKQHPDLNGRLLTAVEQPAKPDEELGYLQQRVIQEALLHSRRSDWGSAISGRRLLLAQGVQWGALAVLIVALWSLHTPGSHGFFLTRVSDMTIAVTPGDTSLERGSSLVVLARFEGALPANVELVLSQSGQRFPLAKSLADPVFGGSVPEVSTNMDYHIEYAGRRTPDYHLTVFEFPRLERADVDLKFPDYTGQPPKRIEDTKRLSAVEGSRLDLALQLNKPVVSAQLVSKEKKGATLVLQNDTNRAWAALREFELEKSATYELQLVDSDGRTNKAPAQFVFNVLTNRIPEFRLDSPRGDIRPSALEELTFDGTVWDDFGVKAYGLGFTVPGKEPKYVELGTMVPAKEKRAFQHVLRLEEMGLGADQLVAWFVWGDDVGPDGQVRRSTSDLYFGEIRPFEEVFREGQGMEGSSQGQQAGQNQGPAAKQAELQKQIMNATWRLKREHPVREKSQSRIEGGVDAGLSAGAPFPLTPALSPGEREHSRRSFGEPTDGLSVDGQAAVLPLPGGEGRGEGERRPRTRIMRQFFGQVSAPDSDADSPTPPLKPRSNSVSNQPPTYESDVLVVRDAQADALQQTEAASRRQQDPRAAALWSTAKQEMKNAMDRLEQATNSPAGLPDALAAEQAAYQALLKLQQHEYQVTRGRNRGGAGGAGGQQLQRQLDQMDLTQSENRYETQRQAQKPQATERREQMQVLNRLQELARRQQDLNERLKELQTALQEAKTEQERDEIQRRLKRLQEEEQQMLADVDELRQRMDRPENQSKMSDERRQLDETRDDVQKASEQAGQGSASQALAAGTRAQRQLQQLRDQVRKDSSSQFSDDMRDMRAQARELATKQEEITKAMEKEGSQERKTLADSNDRQEALTQLEQQKQRMTNLVEHATRVSQQAEEAEPLLSRQLYDTVRKFTQDTSKNLQQAQEDLLSHGLMTRSLYDRLKEGSGTDGAKLMDVASEMLKADFLRQAGEAGQRAQGSIEDLKRGVEHAAESVLGDDTESLRLAQQTLDQLTEQLQKEMAQQAGGRRDGTNQISGPSATLSNTLSETLSKSSNEPSRTNQLSAGAGGGRQGQNENSNPDAQGSEVAQNGQAAPAEGTQEGQRGGGRAGNNQAGRGQPSGERAQAGQPNPNNQASENAQASSANQGQGQGGQNGQAQPGNQGSQGSQGNPGSAGQQSGRDRNGIARNGATRSGRLSLSAGGGGGDGGDISGSVGRLLDDFYDGNAGPVTGPLTGQDFVNWSDRLRDVEEMIEIPELRNNVAVARERARRLRQEFKKDLKKPDWAVVRMQIMKPLLEVRDKIADELARRQSDDNLVPIDRDPVPAQYSDLVRRYYEELGKDK